MKLAIGYRRVEGPWGGGNRFVGALAAAARAVGHQVRFDLADPDIDIAMMIDPRVRSSNFSFAAGALTRYRLWRNPRCIAVHRINECDERKGTRGMNARLKAANAQMDHTVFIASWLKDLDLWWPSEEVSVCLNGADRALFNADRHVPWDGHGPLRLVTHHWGANWRKGFDVYAELDRLLERPEWRGRLAFTYVGNLPAGFAFANARHHPPLDGLALADVLRANHVYLTASLNEPAGMHHIEGALCGLPLLYRNSGALPEYCAGFGEMFEGPDDFVAALERMIARYLEHRAALARYPHTAERMCAAYLAVFDDLMARRDALIARRRLFAHPLAALRNQIPL